MYEQTGSNSSASTLIYYDEKSRPAELYYTTSYLVGNVNTVSETTHKNTYDNEGKLTRYKVSEGNTSYSFMPSYDDFGRVDYKMNVLQTSSGALSSMMDYEYSTNEQYTRWESTQVSKYVWSLGSNISEYNYVYDDNGNIIQIKDDDGVIQHRYEYDILGQLVREDNRPLGKSYVYIYDYAGNRTVKREGAFTLGTVTVTNTVNYDYGNESWGDQLTSAGENYYSYDDIGNMVVRYSDGVHATLTWDGRRLESYEDGTGYYFAYKYDSDGRRISKTSGRGGTISTVYQYNGDKLVCESFDGSIRYYIYDESGSIAGMRYRTSSYAAGVFDEYYFEKNLQGDVVAIYNASGTKLISYKYDAWGNFTTTYHNGGASTSARYNPFRYRGYYYDDSTGLYYLNTRYYDPSIGRFLSADSYVSTGQGIIGNNMYAYCNNNPVMYVDFGGTRAVPYWRNISYVGSGWGEAYGLSFIVKAILAIGFVDLATSAADSLTVPAVPSVSDLDDVKEKAKEKEGIIHNPPPDNDEAIYYFAKITGSGNFVRISHDMGIDEAVGWAFAKSLEMGKNSKWGIYTRNYSDAIKIYERLIPANCRLTPLILENHGVGTYNHLHFPNRKFNDKHDHFHIWFGEIINA